MSGRLEHEISPAMRAAMVDELAPPKPGTSALQDAFQNMQWDKWYASIPDDLKQKLSVHDFRRLGDLFKAAFNVKS